MWLTSIVSVVLTYVLSYLLIANVAGNTDLWWQLSTVITCGTLAGAIIPEFVKVFTSTHSRHVREVVTSSREGGASLNILSGLVAGNFSAYWLGLTILALMAIAYVVSGMGLGAIMAAPAAPPTSPPARSRGCRSCSSRVARATRSRKPSPACGPRRWSR